MPISTKYTQTISTSIFQVIGVDCFIQYKTNSNSSWYVIVLLFVCCDPNNHIAHLRHSKSYQYTLFCSQGWKDREYPPRGEGRESRLKIEIGHNTYQFATFVKRHRILNNNCLALRVRHRLQEIQEKRRISKQHIFHYHLHFLIKKDKKPANSNYRWLVQLKEKKKKELTVEVEGVVPE